MNHLCGRGRDKERDRNRVASRAGAANRLLPGEAACDPHGKGAVQERKGQIKPRRIRQGPAQHRRHDDRGVPEDHREDEADEHRMHGGVERRVYGEQHAPEREPGIPGEQARSDVPGEPFGK